MTNTMAQPALHPRAKTIALALTVAGLLLTGVAWQTDGTSGRLAFASLWAVTFLWSIVLGSLFFVALQHITHAVWSVVVRRVAEMLAAPMWLVAILFVPLLLTFLSDHPVLYAWTDSATVEHDHVLHAKQTYLNVPFFLVRTVVFFALWMAFAAYYVRTSLKQDRGEAGEEATLRMRRVSAPFMLIFALTVSFAGIDWLMSLSPKWFSTIFGVYVFSGLALSSLAAVTIVVIVLRSTGRINPEMVTDHHLYNLGALLFTFSCFWAYIAFSQYMLIWYANMPEESFYLVQRLDGNWVGVSAALGIVRFIVPFLVLLSRRAKTNPRMLLWMSVLILVGQLIDLYWLIMPERPDLGPAFGWQELGPLLLVVGLLLWYVVRFLRKHPPVAVGDPLLDKSVHFRL
jgi:hypothetical protein